MRLLFMSRMLVFMGAMVSRSMYVAMTFFPFLVAMLVRMFMTVGMLMLMTMLVFVCFPLMLVFMFVLVLMLVFVLMLVRMFAFHICSPFYIESGRPSYCVHRKSQVMSVHVNGHDPKRRHRRCAGDLC